MKSYTNPGSTGPRGRFVLNEAGWRARLHAAVKASGHSMRAISLEAGLLTAVRGSFRVRAVRLSRSRVARALGNVCFTPNSGRAANPS